MGGRRGELLLLAGPRTHRHPTGCPHPPLRPRLTCPPPKPHAVCPAALPPACSSRGVRSTPTARQKACISRRYPSFALASASPSIYAWRKGEGRGGGTERWIAGRCTVEGGKGGRRGRRQRPPGPPRRMAAATAATPAGQRNPQDPGRQPANLQTKLQTKLGPHLRHVGLPARRHARPVVGAHEHRGGPGGGKVLQAAQARGVEPAQDVLCPGRGGGEEGEGRGVGQGGGASAGAVAGPGACSALNAGCRDHAGWRGPMQARGTAPPHPGVLRAEKYV